MPIEQINIAQLLEWKGRYPVLDVRSPGEYALAHIPGAYSLPLFSDAERSVVGTAYKQESKQHAIKAGLVFFGPKMVPMIEEVERICSLVGVGNGPGGKTVIVHCWRGGMRSSGVAWLLNLYGFTVYTLAGGYKSFRRWCYEQFAREHPISVIGGFTGSGKTDILHELKKQGSAVVDLEALASHKGSAFGNLGQPQQPSQEMFENRLALALAEASAGDRIWMEDESQRIGNVIVPNILFHQMQSGPVLFLEVPFEERLANVISTYGTFEKIRLADAVLRIRKRLGGMETKTALACLERGDLRGCFSILLTYYDKYYLKCLEHKNLLAEPIRKLPCSGTDPIVNTRLVLQQEVKVNQ